MSLKDNLRKLANRLDSVVFGQWPIPDNAVTLTAAALAERVRISGEECWNSYRVIEANGYEPQLAPEEGLWPRVQRVEVHDDPGNPRVTLTFGEGPQPYMTVMLPWLAKVTIVPDLNNDDIILR